MNHDSELIICKNSIGNKISSDKLVEPFLQMTKHWCYIHLLNMAITFLSLITTVFNYHSNYLSLFIKFTSRTFARIKRAMIVCQGK